MTTDTWLPAPPSPARVLAVAAGAVSDLDDVLWAARPATDLLAAVREAERLRSVLDRVELQVVAEIDARDAAKEEGWGSTAEFVTATSGGRTGAGRAAVALARALDTDRRRTGEVLGLGLISRAQAEVVVTTVDRLPVNPRLRDAAEQLLLDEARTRDASELAAAGRHLLARLDPEGEERRDERALEREERAAHLSRFLSIAEDGIGSPRARSGHAGGRCVAQGSTAPPRRSGAFCGTFVRESVDRPAGSLRHRGVRARRTRPA